MSYELPETIDMNKYVIVIYIIYLSFHAYTEEVCLKNQQFIRFLFC